MAYPDALDLLPLNDAGFGYPSASLSVGVGVGGGCFHRERDRQPRKGHKKSRRGCYECKRRKIKCQETRPTCQNCSRLSLRCRYLPDSASIVTRSTPLLQPFSALQVANVFSMTDMRLFHHFLVAAWPHLPVRADNVWLEYVLPIGHQVSSFCVCFVLLGVRSWGCSSTFICIEGAFIHSTNIACSLWSFPHIFLLPLNVLTSHHRFYFVVPIVIHSLLSADVIFPCRNSPVYWNDIGKNKANHPIQCEYLMHAMLALSASHLERLTPSHLTSTAQSHRLLAISGLNTALSRLLPSSTDGDAAIATCYALLMQSWYMDDGLSASIILTRSVNSTTKWVREQRVRSLLACDDEGTRRAGMKGRLRGAPGFEGGFVDGAVGALGGLEGLCEGEGYQRGLYGVLRGAFEMLRVGAVACYDAYISLDTFLSSLPSASLTELLDPSIRTNQILLAYLTALHLVMRPISCRERRQYTVSFYGIRMSTWIPGIWNELGRGEVQGFGSGSGIEGGIERDVDWRKLMEWPMWVSGLHGRGELEKWSLEGGACASGKRKTERVEVEVAEQSWRKRED
ncbi:hypothetical protein ONS95_011875 [Cadophora gregata]|uniref:uncharacterized protein n=1 Tax=Cadophora gregata TaxID=51156 RepID=UPI0026DB713E|nr:uncharacterized protein ONS95_011875 [Cadophora gregata]KAK0117536.1 hypothetical protein ONS95_011875 [Cadophora gregata]